MDPVSPLKAGAHVTHDVSACSDCGTAFAPGDYLAHFVCPSCGHPQPASRSDYFAAFGVPERFAQDRAELERRFYAVSRALHPDRFRAGGDRQQMERSLERMAFLNQAYTTLTDPDALRAYVLERAGFNDKSEKIAPPAQLAEEWFELQERAMDNPENSVLDLQEFTAGLIRREADGAAVLAEIESRADAAWADGRKAPLDELHRKLHELSYLRSLIREVNRLRSRQGAGGTS